MSVAHELGSCPRTRDVLLGESVTFKSLLLSDTVHAGLTGAGFTTPSPIQLRAIPLGKCGLDLVIQAKSGTGKTVVFTVIALEMVNVSVAVTQCLVVVPTREVAVQVKQVMDTIGRTIPELRVHHFIGGMSVSDDKLKARHCHIAVGTPGRLKQIIKQKWLKVDTVKLFVLDEADRLVEGSFKETINWMYNMLPGKKQVLCVSATYPKELAQHLTIYMRNPSEIRLDADKPALLGIHQLMYPVKADPQIEKSFMIKTKHLIHILNKVNFNQCLVFSNYHAWAENLCVLLKKHGWPAICISGHKGQTLRLDALDALQKFKCRVLVSTDVMARGIDAENVNMVVNLDVPWDAATYLHRIGRAGRFGSLGLAITLASEGEEVGKLQNLIYDVNVNMYYVSKDRLGNAWDNEDDTLKLVEKKKPEPVIANVETPTTNGLTKEEAPMTNGHSGDSVTQGNKSSSEKAGSAAKYGKAIEACIEAAASVQKSKAIVDDREFYRDGGIKPRDETDEERSSDVETSDGEKYSGSDIESDEPSDKMLTECKTENTVKDVEVVNKDDINESVKDLLTRDSKKQGVISFDKSKHFIERLNSGECKPEDVVTYCDINVVETHDVDTAKYDNISRYIKQQNQIICDNHTKLCDEIGPKLEQVIGKMALETDQNHEHGDVVILDGDNRDETTVIQDAENNDETTKEEVVECEINAAETCSEELKSPSSSDSELDDGDAQILFPTVEDNETKDENKNTDNKDVQGEQAKIMDTNTPLTDKQWKELRRERRRNWKHHYVTDTTDTNTEQRITVSMPEPVKGAHSFFEYQKWKHVDGSSEKEKDKQKESERANFEKGGKKDLEEQEKEQGKQCFEDLQNGYQEEPSRNYVQEDTSREYYLPEGNLAQVNQTDLSNYENGAKPKRGKKKGKRKQKDEGQNKEWTELPHNTFHPHPKGSTRSRVEQDTNYPSQGNYPYPNYPQCYPSGTAGYPYGSFGYSQAQDSWSAYMWQSWWMQVHQMRQYTEYMAYWNYINNSVTK